MDEVVRLRAPAVPNTLSLVRDFDSFLGAQQMAPSTRRLYRYGVLRFLAEACPGDLAEVTEDHVAAFVNSLGDRSSSKAHYLKALKAFFAWCRRRGHVAVDPTAALRTRKVPLREVASLTEQELGRYLLAAEARSPRRRWALQLQYAVGARRMEVAGIRPEDVDLEALMVILRETKYGKPRKMELGPVALAALEGLRPWRSPRLIGVRPQTITEWAEDAARASGLQAKCKGRASHILRATCVTRLLANGLPIQVVSRMVGHSNVAVTDRYADPYDKAERERGVQLL